MNLKSQTSEPAFKKIRIFHTHTHTHTNRISLSRKKKSPKHDDPHFVHPRGGLWVVAVPLEEALATMDHSTHPRHEKLVFIYHHMLVIALNCGDSDLSGLMSIRQTAYRP